VKRSGSIRSLGSREKIGKRSLTVAVPSSCSNGCSNLQNHARKQVADLPIFSRLLTVAVPYGAGVLRRRARQGGSAMLIVFLFAAIVAIMLYRELPVTLFEARRQKEELLVDRGHEYTRAVQLYYRRFRGQYPASIEQLENTNSIRFLRHRFKDPFTGKEDWRLLHAGPGGMLIDSKVNPIKQPNSSNGSSGIGGFGSAGTSRDAATSHPVDTSASSDTTPGVVVPPLRSSRPAISADGSDNASSPAPTTAELDQNPATPLLAVSEPDTQAASAPGGLPGEGQGPAQSPGQGTPANSPQAGAAAMAAVQNLISSAANGPQAQQSAFGQNQQQRQLGGGSLAGIASRATGHTIKRVNDQSDYSLWEFYYDPSKDTSMGNPIAGGGGAAPNGMTNPNSNNSAATTGNSGFRTGGFNTVPDGTVATPDSSSAGQPADGSTPNQNGKQGTVTPPPVQAVPITPLGPSR
jgi:hypothetical protein